MLRRRIEASRSSKVLISGVNSCGMVERSDGESSSPNSAPQDWRLSDAGMAGLGFSGVLNSANGSCSLGSLYLRT